MKPIAIVGLDCRFPGAIDPAAYWDLLGRAGDGVRKVPELRWEAADFYSSDKDHEGRSNTVQGGFIDDVDAFDNEFFTVSPREAAAMDPQQRLLLQTAWRALEDANVSPKQLAGTMTGVFVGIMGNEWGQVHMTDYDHVTAQTGSGNGYCMTANRISYHLDLKGPSLAVDTACSSSLVAVHLACNSLLSEECDYALAGGVNVAVTPGLSIFYNQAGLSAPDGRCKPFSADADGIGRAEGVGMVVLRRLEDAIADGQQVYAVIRGTAVNQDGRSNGITAPNRWSQQEVLAAAYRRAGVTADQVTFLEAHGTGTALGDMIEVNALGHLHANRADRPLAVGSVKGNIGHAEGAAGMAGLIKVALALHHRTVPASRFAAKENPKLQLAKNGLRLLKAPLRLPAGPTVAGLSSFGMGGTNTHAVLETAPASAARPSLRGGTGRPATGVFTLTAPTADALRRNLLAQAGSLPGRRGPAAGLCWTSNQVKTGHKYRFAAAVGDTRELAESMRAAAADEDFAGLAGQPSGTPKVAFLFTGQGSQHERMTAGLYRDWPLYRRFLDEADEALLPHVGESVRDLVLSGDPRIHRTAFAQPALFAVGYAQTAALAELGLYPDLVLGHSVGEYAAACAAGVLTLRDAARLIAARGALMQELPAGGGMLSVRAALADVEELLAGEPLVGVAAINGPRDTVLSGDLAALGRIGEALTAGGTAVRALQVSHAFHSPLMEPMLERFAEAVSGLGTGEPRMPVLSTVEGRQLVGEPMDAGYWLRHISAPVRFGAAAEQLLATGPTHLVEIGPRPVLTSMVRRLRPPAGLRSLHLCPTEEAGGPEVAAVVAELFRGGEDPHWEALYQDQDRVLQRLAPYAFSTAHRYWSRNPVRAPRLGQPAAVSALPQAGAGTATDPHVVVDIDRSVELPDPLAQVVLAAIAKVGEYVPEEISMRSRLYEDLGFDSVMVMELKGRIEAKLPAVGELSVQDLLPRLSSVGELVGFLRELGAAQVAEELSTTTA